MIQIPPAFLFLPCSPLDLIQFCDFKKYFWQMKSLSKTCTRLSIINTHATNNFLMKCLGRCMIASADIAPGELIFREQVSEIFEKFISLLVKLNPGGLNRPLPWHTTHLPNLPQVIKNRQFYQTTTKIFDKNISGESRGAFFATNVGWESHRETNCQKRKYLFKKKQSWWNPGADVQFQVQRGGGSPATWMQGGQRSFDDQLFMKLSVSLLSAEHHILGNLRLSCSVSSAYNFFL